MAAAAETGLRALVVWCPDWPIVASGRASEVPVVTVFANRVVAASAAARTYGVRRGLRRREAQSRCPTLEVIEADPSGDARAWEPVVCAIEAFTPTVEIVRPGAVALATRGPSRYFGGDDALAGRIAAAVDAAVAQAWPGAPACRVGVADGRFAAEQAARAGGGVVVVPAGGSRPFLAPLPITTLPYSDLASLLRRLGIETLGDLAALPAPSVLARFGPDGAVAHRLAGGLDERPLAARVPPPELVVSTELDPPAERVDTAAFVAKALADELHERLSRIGLACSRVAIQAETEHGEHLSRLWRHDGALTAGAIAERVRWQLDGWLNAGGGTTGGLTLLRLAPDQVHPDNGRQLGFWGRSVDDGIVRTLARVQGILGPQGVATAVLTGGRDPSGQVRLVPWGDQRDPRDPDRTRSGSAGSRGGRRSGPEQDPAPWPGRLPGPAPAVVHQPPLPAEVRDAASQPVTVSGRGEASADPVAISIASRPWQDVIGWAGPWPVEDRWWDGAGRRRARYQVVVAGGVALLLVRESNQWAVEATYD